MNPIAAAGRLLLDLLYPRKCVFCHRILPRNEADICAECYKSLPEPKHPVRKGEFYTGCVSALVYCDSVRSAVHRFKFYQCPHYAAVFAPLLAAAIMRNGGASYDVVTWAPISRERLRKRGYDQGQLLAQETAKLLSLPCARLLEKTLDTPTQSRQTYERRKANVLGAYRVPDGDGCRKKRILLIDDVITSGSTLSECSKELLLAGAASVGCATLAQAGKTEKQVKV